MNNQEEELRATVTRLVQDFKMHDDMINTLKQEVGKLSTDVAGLRELLIESNGKSEVYMQHVQQQNEQMLSLLTDSQRRRDELSIKQEEAKQEAKALNQKQTWAVVMAIVAGAGSIITGLLQILTR